MPGRPPPPPRCVITLDCIARCARTKNRLPRRKRFRYPHLFEFALMFRAVKRSAAEAIKTSAPRKPGEAGSALPRLIGRQLCQLVETAPSGPQWLHEIKLDGFRMSARIEHRRVQFTPKRRIVLNVDLIRA